MVCALETFEVSVLLRWTLVVCTRSINVMTMSEKFKFCAGLMERIGVEIDLCSPNLTITCLTVVIICIPHVQITVREILTFCFQAPWDNPTLLQHISQSIPLFTVMTDKAAFLSEGIQHTVLIIISLFNALFDHIIDEKYITVEVCLKACFTRVFLLD